MHSHAKCQSCKMSVMQNVSHAKCAPQSGYEWEMCATRENNEKCASQQRSQWMSVLQNVRRKVGTMGNVRHETEQWKMCVTAEIPKENVRHNRDPYGKCAQHNRDPSGKCAPQQRATWKMCATAEVHMENVRHNRALNGKCASQQRSKGKSFPL